MGSGPLKALTRAFLRRYRKRQVTPSVRAVLLGDGVSTHVILDGTYEKYELEALENEVFPKIPKTSTCLDIGANIGNHASVFARHFARVVAFEPNPVVGAVLTANSIGRNITVVPLGLSDRKATLPFQQDFENMGASRISDRATADMTIEVDRLDDIADTLGLADVGFVKIDVEGHEPQVLRGATAFLARHQPVIALEAFFAHHPQLGTEIAALLDTAGYRHLYALKPASPLVARLQGTALDPARGLLRVLLPERMRKARTLERIDSALGRDHQLLIASPRPLI